MHSFSRPRQILLGFGAAALTTFLVFLTARYSSELTARVALQRAGFTVRATIHGREIRVAWGIPDSQGVLRLPPGNAEKYKHEKLTAHGRINGKVRDLTLRSRVPNTGRAVVTLPSDIPPGTELLVFVTAIDRLGRVTLLRMPSERPIRVTATPGEPVAGGQGGDSGGGGGGGGGSPSGGGSGGGGSGGGGGGGGTPPPAGPPRSLVGVIRWDAWTDSFEDVGRTAQRSLGPQRWRDRLPFFGRELAADRVGILEDSQEVRDAEIAAAKAAGIDYWIFGYFPFDDEYQHGLRQYLSSPRKNEMRFSLLLGRLDDAVQWQSMIRRVVGHFQDPLYQRVAGDRPLLYLFDFENSYSSEAEAARALDQLRQASLAAGAGRPYFVLMDFTPAEAARKVESMGLDAFSSYAPVIPLEHRERPYAELIAENRSRREEALRLRKQVIPLVAACLDPRPLWELVPRPDWYLGDPAAYYTHSTPQEFAANLRETLEWNAAHPELTEANTVVVYAWNEYAECGQGLAPTVNAGAAHLAAAREVLRGPGDSAPPAISGLAVSGITRAGATIQWATDEYAYATVEYGSDQRYGQSAPLNPLPDRSHTVTLPGLVPGTTYHFRIVSRDLYDNVSTSADTTFTTPQF